MVSDHVDWPSLLAAVEATGAERVWVTHGYREPVVRWLRERGLEAQAIASHWEGEAEAEDAPPPDVVGGDGVPGDAGDAAAGETSAGSVDAADPNEAVSIDGADEGDLPLAPSDGGGV